MMTRELLGVSPTRFPAIPVESWREEAACAFHKDKTLWDAGPDRQEADRVREARQAQAKKICRTECPVREVCAATVDPRFDEGVRGGHTLPPLNATSRSNASARDAHLSRLLRAGVPLDEAVRVVQHRMQRRAS